MSKTAINNNNAIHHGWWIGGAKAANALSLTKLARAVPRAS